MKKELTPEQQAIVAKWEAEGRERQKLIDQLEDQIDDPSLEDYKNLLDKLIALTPDRCEHDRSIMGTCMACEEIERIIHPELFEDEDGWDDE